MSFCTFYRDLVHKLARKEIQGVKSRFSSYMRCHFFSLTKIDLCNSYWTKDSCQLWRWVENIFQFFVFPSRPWGGWISRPVHPPVLLPVGKFIQLEMRSLWSICGLLYTPIYHMMDIMKSISYGNQMSVYIREGLIFFMVFYHTHIKIRFFWHPSLT